MTSLSKILLASALALTVAVPAIADAEIATLKERNVYLFMNGKMMSVQLNDRTHAMAMQHFKPLANGTMIYASGGKLYVGQDVKMANGKMLHTEFFGKDHSVGAY